MRPITKPVGEWKDSGEPLGLDGKPVKKDQRKPKTSKPKGEKK